MEHSNIITDRTVDMDTNATVAHEPTIYPIDAIFIPLYLNESSSVYYNRDILRIDTKCFQYQPIQRCWVKVVVHFRLDCKTELTRLLSQWSKSY